MSRHVTRKRLLLALLPIVAAAGLFLALALSNADSNPTTPPQKGISKSEESAKLNDAYLNYVRMNNPELQSEPNGNLLVVGYKICGDIHNYSEQILVNMAEMQFKGAGQRVYDGATQYLCE